MKLLRKILLIFSLGFITCLTLFFGIYCIATKNVKLEPEKLLLPDTQVCIFDQAGKKLHGKTPFSRREIVELEQLPKHLPDAFVATEDKRFYRHHGFDLHGICRATVKNVKSHSLKEGASFRMESASSTSTSVQLTTSKFGTFVRLILYPPLNVLFFISNFKCKIFFIGF